MKRPRIYVLAVLLMFASLGVPAGVVAQPLTPPPSPGVPTVTAAGAVLVNTANDSLVLFGRRLHAARAPASLTKVVTALVARDQYELSEVVTAAPRVLQTEGSRLGLEPGMQHTVEDLLYALLLKSGNDVAIAVAAHHPLGYAHFIKLMNEKARSLGAYESHFENPHGLDQPGHFSTPWDMAIFGRQLLADPELAKIVSTRGYQMPWKVGEIRTFDNHNKLLEMYPGAIGVKTGFTLQAGHSLIGAARTPAGMFLTVVMGSQDHYQDTIALFEHGKAAELGVTAGGGGIDGGLHLSAPPDPLPDLVPPLAPIGVDPRDEPFWTVMILSLAVLTAAAVGLRRRRHPLQDAADLNAWLEPTVPAER